MVFIISGSAGFIGFSLSKFLLDKKFTVIGIDNLDNYYSPILKKKRLKILSEYKNFKFYKHDISEKFDNKIKLNKKNQYLFIHLAAQAGVEYSLVNPQKYITSNILGSYNVISFCKFNNINKVLYASSSSVYGDIKSKSFQEDKTGNSKSFYSLSKKFTEEIFNFESINIQSIGMRFFTVFGPYGRPDMAIYKFMNANLNEQQIELRGYGKYKRDFTYVNDVVRSIYHLSFKKFKKRHQVLNIGFGNSISLITLISEIEAITKKKSIIKLVEGKNFEVDVTNSNSLKIIKLLPKNFRVTDLKKALRKYYEWHLKFYK